jgi:hypothetical protein
MRFLIDNALSPLAWEVLSQCQHGAVDIRALDLHKDRVGGMDSGGVVTIEQHRSRPMFPSSV